MHRILLLYSMQTKDIQENQFQVVYKCMLLIKGHFPCDIRTICKMVYESHVNDDYYLDCKLYETYKRSV